MSPFSRLYAAAMPKSKMACGSFGQKINDEMLVPAVGQVFEEGAMNIAVCLSLSVLALFLLRSEAVAGCQDASCQGVQRANRGELVVLPREKNSSVYIAGVAKSINDIIVLYRENTGYFQMDAAHIVIRYNIYSVMKGDILASFDNSPEAFKYFSGMSFEEVKFSQEIVIKDIEGRNNLNLKVLFDQMKCYSPFAPYIAIDHGNISYIYSILVRLRGEYKFEIDDRCHRGTGLGANLKSLSVGEEIGDLGNGRVMITSPQNGVAVILKMSNLLRVHFMENIFVAHGRLVLDLVASEEDELETLEKWSEFSEKLYEYSVGSSR